MHYCVKLQCVYIIYTEKNHRILRCVSYISIVIYTSCVYIRELQRAESVIVSEKRRRVQLFQNKINNRVTHTRIYMILLRCALFSLHITFEQQQTCYREQRKARIIHNICVLDSAHRQLMDRAPIGRLRGWGHYKYTPADALALFSPI